jgi:hypothetical protein
LLLLDKYVIIKHSNLKNKYKGGLTMAKAWLIRAEFNSGNVMDKFVNDSLIAIDYSSLSSLSNLSTDEMKQELKDKYASFNERQVSMRLNTLVRMATDAQIGDFVVATDKEIVNFGKIVSDYVYDATKIGEDMAHYRKVDWLKGPMKRAEVPDIIRMSLQAPISFSDISHLAETINSFINGTMTAYQSRVSVKEKSAGKVNRKPRAGKESKDVKLEKVPKAPLRTRRTSETENIKTPPSAPAPKPVDDTPAPVYESPAVSAPVYEPPAPVLAAPSGGTDTSDSSALKPFSYPIRFDQNVIIQLPSDITQQEAARLADFVRTLYFK